MNHIALTQEIENEIVNFCLNELQIPFGDFWYEWFNSNKKGNFTLHIKSNGNISITKEKLFKLSFIKKIFKLSFFNKRSYGYFEDDLCYEYIIHFNEDIK
jgi:hypothetical protein